MRTVRLQPVTSVKRHATEIIATLRTSTEPLVITERGRATAVMMGIDCYDAMQTRLELLEGVARGERAIREGRVISHAAATRRLRRWLVPAK